MLRMAMAVVCLAVSLVRAQPVEVEFKGADGFELSGTLLLPEAEGRRPAMLLLPGSGPTDRDGNQPPMMKTDLLKQIAERLAAEGVATLRFDKRAAHVHMEKWPKGLEAMGEVFAFEKFVGDATAAYRFLRGHERIDPARVGILGHSEGGLIALQIGADLAESEERPAALILAATAGRVLDEVLREQISALLKKQTQDEKVRAEYMGHLERGIAAAKAGEAMPADMPIGLKPLFNASVAKLLHAYFTIDPAELAKKVRGPVLILQGEKDAQVSAERDLPRLESALRSREGRSVEVVVVEGASHNFKEVKGEDDLAFMGPVMPRALEGIGEWCGKVLGK